MRIGGIMKLVDEAGGARHSSCPLAHRHRCYRLDELSSPHLYRLSRYRHCSSHCFYLQIEIQVHQSPPPLTPVDSLSHRTQITDASFACVTSQRDRLPLALPAIVP